MLQTSVNLGFDEALAKLPEIERVAGLNPNNYEDVQNYGSHLFAVGRVEEALKQFHLAIKLRPDSANVLLNLGMAYKELGDFDRADDYIKQSYDQEGEFWYARLAWSESLLRRGRWDEAWPIYEKCRFTKKNMRDAANIPAEAIPLWTVDSKTGLQPDGERSVPMHVFIMGEGGWGDRINYSRYLPRMADLNIPFLHNIDCGFMGEQLASIFNRQGFLGTKLELGMPVCFTHWNTVFGLPSAFRATPDSLPTWPKPWIADAELTEKFRGIRASDKPNIGLIWNAGEAFEGKRKFRSMTEWQAARLVIETQEQIHWINLQYGWTAPSAPMVNLPIFTSWEHTMAGMANCDAIITVDTGPMHLAGAMSKPMWILLPGNSDWKFMLQRDDCVFYPSAKLWRNVGQGFENVLDRVIRELKNGVYPR